MGFPKCGPQPVASASPGDGKKCRFEPHPDLLNRTLGAGAQQSVFCLQLILWFALTFENHWWRETKRPLSLTNLFSHLTFVTYKLCCREKKIPSTLLGPLAGLIITLTYNRLTEEKQISFCRNGSMIKIWDPRASLAVEAYRPSSPKEWDGDLGCQRAIHGTIRADVCN